MKPLKITAELLDGRVNSADGLFNLDSLIAYAWMKENEPDRLYNGDIMRDGLIEPDLPLEWREDHWAASSGFYIQVSESIEYWHRHLNGDRAERYVDFNGKRGTINTKSGEYKAYRMPQTIRVIPSIEFYAMGDPIEIDRLLTKYITNIGKKSSQGYGHIKSWTIRPVEEDWTEKGPYGIMRPTPFNGELPNKEVYQVRSYGLKPPYWLKDNQSICLIPNVRRDYLVKSAITDQI
ncbi:hypothetical protein GCM10011391_28190 [Pullulanibacillus camelliae]|uniref:Uncharacterized protein n=1 Tax=Pullulanibacillus camelliae TaxID=1707096 RepID=A0A8J2YK56_9BACL|nr:hypothetical protein [Pullulanibacillus camelliae]GGE47784.1 hypothetical protein GCM10011391_28190 [Pullulanibacillus camelliae]